jgi:tetratricopeptide (TPR) repeat protein
MARSSRSASLALALLAACASAPAPQETLSLNQQAAEAYARGDFSSSRSAFSKAIQIHQKNKNAEGTALNALSLARVEQSAGDFEAAQRALDLVLASEAAPGLRAEAAGRKALIHLSAGELKEAADWQARAQALCGGCRAQAAILNIGARIALAAGNGAAATQLAERVLKLPSSEEARAEQANAQRILAEAAALPRLAQPSMTSEEKIQ